MKLSFSLKSVTSTKSSAAAAVADRTSSMILTMSADERASEELALELAQQEQQKVDLLVQVMKD